MEESEERRILNVADKMMNTVKELGEIVGYSRKSRELSKRNAPDPQYFITADNPIKAEISRILAEFKQTLPKHLDNLINQKHTDSKAATGGENMPPKYSDGTFRLRKSGIYEYRFMHLDKQISVYGKSKEECFNRRTDIIAGKTKNKALRVYTFGEWLLKWFETYKKPRNGAESLKTMRAYIDNAIIPVLGKKALNRIDGIDLQNFINKYANRTNTQNKIAGILRGALEKAQKIRMIRFNPFDSVELMPHKSKSYRALEFKEQRFIYNAITVDKYRKLFFFCCCTGIRIRRVLELTAADFDRERGEITVIKKQHKGLNEVYKVPFLPSLIELPKSGKLFSGFTYSGARLYFDKLFAKLGIENAHLHSFRHTFISVCYHIGVKDKQIQAWAGHSTLEMTMNTYTHLLKNNENSPILEYLKELKQGLDV
jgi:integrase